MNLDIPTAASHAITHLNGILNRMALRTHKVKQLSTVRISVWLIDPLSLSFLGLLRECRAECRAINEGKYIPKHTIIMPTLSQLQVNQAKRLGKKQ